MFIFTRKDSQLTKNVYISHHSSNSLEAEELTRLLAQLNSFCNLNVSHFGTILPGQNIESEIFDNIKNAHIIIVLVSMYYLSENQHEIESIKKSNSFKNAKVIPVPIESCLWHDHFPNIMPLPSKLSYRNFSDNKNEFWYHVVLGIKSIIEQQKLNPFRNVPIILARADSSSVEPSQDYPSNFTLNLKISDEDILVQIEGDSMSPIYKEGDLVVCKPIESLTILSEMVTSNKHSVFVIKTLTQGVLLKYIGKISDEYITLVSHNSSHKNLIFHLSEIDRIFLIKQSVKIREEH